MLASAAEGEHITCRGLKRHALKSLAHNGNIYCQAVSPPKCSATAECVERHQTTFLMRVDIVSVVHSCCSRWSRFLHERGFLVFILSSVVLVCGESSVNINDAIFFKLDNFSILQARSLSFLLAVLFLFTKLLLYSQRKWQAAKNFSHVISWSRLMLRLRSWSKQPRSPPFATHI